MKTSLKSLVSIAMVLSLGTIAAFGQSCAAVSHVSTAVQHSGNASRELVAASAESGAASIKVASGVAAVPVFASGLAVASSGAAISALGESAVAAGTTTAEGAEKMWDFSTSDPAQRPALARERTVPPVKKTMPPTPVDPSPAEALKTKI